MVIESRLPLKNSALDYLAKQANAWRRGDYYSEIEPALLLYVLALAGKPNMAAMNRMEGRYLRKPDRPLATGRSLRLGQTRKDCQSVDRQSSGRS
ncbi:MAG: hypothetical protein V8R91_11765 [Butyricimonas faecihominis]